MLHWLQGLLLHSAHRRTTLDARSLLHRRRTSTASHQALGEGVRGAGFDNTIVGTLQTATQLRRHYLVHCAGSSPAAGSGWLQGCCVRGLASLDYTIFCTLRRKQAPAGCWAAARGGIASFDNTILCTLLAAIRQPAPARCRVAARGGLACLNYTIFCTLLAAVRQPAPASCRAAARGRARRLR